MQNLKNIVGTSDVEQYELLNNLQEEFKDFKTYLNQFYIESNNIEFKKDALAFAIISLIEVNKLLLKLQYISIDNNIDLRKFEESKSFCIFLLDSLFMENKINIQAIGFVNRFAMDYKSVKKDEIIKILENNSDNEECGCNKKGDE